MPVITALGLRWQIASDFIPFLAAWGLLSHCIWFLIVGILFLTSRPATCAPVNDTNANLYESVVDGTLAMFAATMLIEIVLIIIGLRGGRLTRATPACRFNRVCHYSLTLNLLDGDVRQAICTQARRSRSPSARR
jgi:hypothetical protein